MFAVAKSELPILLNIRFPLYLCPLDLHRGRLFSVRRTLAPCGQTPVLSCWDRRDRISAISCITLSPREGRPGQGYLHADAFSGYDGLYLPDPCTAAARIIEVTCNAHARRKFYEARGSDAVRSHQALAYYRQLYELERHAKDFSDTQRHQMRQELSLPILERFHEWLFPQRPEVLSKSPMGEATSYALNN